MIAIEPVSVPGRLDRQGGLDDHLPGDAFAPAKRGVPRIMAVEIRAEAPGVHRECSTHGRWA